jgi:hypothetical protein
VIEVRCISLFVRKHLKEILNATIDPEAKLALATRYYSYGFQVDVATRDTENELSLRQTRPGGVTLKILYRRYCTCKNFGEYEP